jgi:alanine-glyoxylate transaminase/serine-glyoxylate transaminase/serine-pyruvate transaminase
MPGRKFLAIPGPTNVPERVRQAMAIPMEDQRSPDLPAFTLPLFEDLKRVFKTRDGSVLIFPASGTGGWEAAIANTLSPGDRVLAVRFGVFSGLWIEMCRRYGLEVDIIDCEWGTGIPVETVAARLADDRAHAIKAVLACHNETATGVTSDIAGVRAALDAARHPALLFVDGVSSIASIDFRMDEWGVDVAVSGSQKGFMLPTGLAIVAVSPKALDATKTASLPRGFFDFGPMLKANRDGYFPYTPPLTLIRGLRASVDLLLEEGLENVFRRHRHLADAVRAAVAAWNLRLCAKKPEFHSDTVSAIVVPEGADAAAIVRLAYERYDLSLGVGLAQLAGKVFRIGHLGDLNALMVLASIAGAEMAMRDAGIGIDAGSGVAAAQAHLQAGSTRASEKNRAAA